MKKLILAFLMMLPVVLALTLEGEGYSAGETLVLSANAGNEVPRLFLNQSEVKIGFVKVTSKNKNYFYTHLPEDLEEGSYTLSYGNENITFLTNISPAILLVKNPVVVLQDEGEFSVALENKGENAFTVNVETNLQPARTSLELLAGETKNLFVKYNQSGFLKLNYEGKMRSVILLQQEEEVVVENVTPEGNVSVLPEIKKAHLFFLETPSSIKHVVSRTRVIEGNLEFMTDASEVLKDVTFRVNGSLKAWIELNVSKYPEVKAGEVYGQHLWVNRKKDAPAGVYRAEISMIAENAESSVLELEVEFTDKEEEAGSVPLEEKKVEIIEEPIITAINISGEQAEEESKNLKAGLITVGIIILILALIAYKLRPKKKTKQFEELIKPGP